jgi:hypothetical protein
MKYMGWCGIDMRVVTGVLETPAQQADRIAALSLTPVLFISHALNEGEGDPNRVMTQDMFAVLRARGFDLSYQLPGFTTLFTAMRDHVPPIVPQGIRIDCEDGWDYWSVMGKFNGAGRVAFMQTFYDDPEIQSTMTVEMQNLEPADFEAWGAHYYEWSMWINQFKVNALNEIVNVANTVFGTTFVATNWWDATGGNFPVYDFNGVRMPSESLTDQWSAPDFYFEIGKGVVGFQKHPYWNALIILLNYIRCLDPATMTAWLAPRTYHLENGYAVVTQQFVDWLWDKLVRLMINGGVWNFIWWNPATENGGVTTAADNQALSDIFDAFPNPIAPTYGLDPIPMDADIVTMGAMSLTYGEFLAALNPSAELPTGGEISAHGLGVGSGPYYSRVFNKGGRVWAGSSLGFIPLGAGSYAASIKTAVTDPENSDAWTGDAPAGSIEAGATSFEIRAGDIPTAADTDAIVWTDPLGAGGGAGGSGGLSVDQEKTLNDIKKLVQA